MKNELKKRIKRTVILVVLSGVACVVCGIAAARCFWEHVLVGGIVELVLMVINSVILANSISDLRAYRGILGFMERRETDEKES